MDQSDAMTPTADAALPPAIPLEAESVAAPAHDEAAARAPVAAKADPSVKSELLESLKTALYAGLLFLVVRVLLFQPFTIPSASMEPNLLRGDYIIVSKFAYGISRHSMPFSPPLFKGRLFGQAPKRGDVVVFKLPRDGRTDYIKRLVGLPGDRVQVKKGVILVNGKAFGQEEMAPAPEPGPFGLVRRYCETNPEGRSYVTADFGAGGEVDDTPVFVVPAKHYFFVGDNRDNSQDSRYPEEIGVGYVPEENLVGRAEVVLLSWGGDASLFKPWTWISDLRPDRVFRPLN